MIRDIHVYYLGSEDKGIRDDRELIILSISEVKFWIIFTLFIPLNFVKKKKEKKKKKRVIDEFSSIIKGC